MISHSTVSIESMYRTIIDIVFGVIFNVFIEFRGFTPFDRFVSNSPYYGFALKINQFDLVYQNHDK